MLNNNNNIIIIIAATKIIKLVDLLKFYVN